MISLEEMEVKNLGILIIDMQDEFLDYIKGDKRKLLEAQYKVLDFAIEYIIPVINIRERHHGRINTDLARKLREVPRRQYKIKECNNSFFQSNLDIGFNDRFVDHIWMMGLYANMCVLESGKGARRHGFNVLISLDTVGAPEKTYNWENPSKPKKVDMKVVKRNYMKEGIIFRDNYT